jgi:hypothetical protein
MAIYLILAAVLGAKKEALTCPHPTMMMQD